MPTRTTATRPTSSKASAAKRTRTRNGATSAATTRKKPALKSERFDSAEEEDDDDDAYNDEEDADDAESINSDNLDDDDAEYASLKRKRGPKSPGKGKNKVSPNKKSTLRKKRKTTGHEDAEDSDIDVELQEGQEIVGKVIQAPKTGRVPPGQISQNTLNFLSQLKKPECNDREWFKLHEPVYRLAEKEWKEFVEAFTDVLVAADPQIPHLPPKDVIHRIYRDIRFSNDKTPYKTGFSASLSRSGRKGIFAGFRPGESLIAAGSWCPAKNELATIRNNLLRSSTRFRKIISSPTFVGLFGEASPDPKGGRRSIFGREDELKVAPKGVPKDHKDIDILKCRSFAVVYEFTDKQVLQPDFKDELGRLVKILRPFVHCLNDLMTIQDTDSSDTDDEDEDAQDSEHADAVSALSEDDE